MSGVSRCTSPREGDTPGFFYFFKTNQEIEIKRIFIFLLSFVLSSRRAAESRRDSSPSAAGERHSQRSARGQCRTSVAHNSTSMKASFEGVERKKKGKEMWRGGKKKRPVMKH